MNSVNLLGRLTKDPETKDAGSKSKTVFTIAVNRTKDKADFILCEAWEKTGELIAEYFSKGNRIGVTGRLQIDTWKDDAGNYKSKAYVNVRSIDFIETKAESQQQTPAPAKAPQRWDEPAEDQAPPEPEGDYLPF
jgi:single-strand DNA-binding protein